MSIDLELAFVDSIDDAYTVRLDLEDGANIAVHRDTRFDPPPLRYATAGTLTRDGDFISASAYANREIRLVLTLDDALSLDDMAAQFQLVFRELNRPSNILRYRPGTSEPIYFRTFRASAESVEFIPTERLIRATVPAEPFGYGEKETLSPISVSGDPSAANGCYFDVSDPKGDVGTPLFFEVPYTDVTVALSRNVSVMGVRRATDASSTPRFIQAETRTTVGADTSTPGNDVLMSGAGSNYVRTSFATVQALTDRFYLTLSPSTGTPLRGRYRMYLRVRQNTAGDVMRIQVNLNGSTIQNDPVTTTGGTTAKWIEVGEANIPVTMDQPQDGFSGIDTDVQSPQFYVQLGRDSGAGTFDVDCLLLIPADDRFCAIRWVVQAASNQPDHITVDGDANSAVARSSTDAIHLSGISEIIGQVPELSPGVTNRVHFLRSVYDATNSPVFYGLTSTVAITPFYWPRYLAVRPVGS